jgi:excinuclease ABC subunit A
MPRAKKSEQKDENQEYIEIYGAAEHNLKNVDIKIPINKMTVITGISGSGKSTLAFDTLYAEGQRRYVESLSSYARQFLGIMNKPKVQTIKGLSPAISIEQKSISHNPRSTVGTITEIYDYFRLFFARIGKPHCPLCQQRIQPQDAQSITQILINKYLNQKVQILAPIIRGKKGHFQTLFEDLVNQGFARARVDGEFIDLANHTSGTPKLDRYKPHTIELVVDRLQVGESSRTRLTDSLEQALGLAHGLVLILSEKPGSVHHVGHNHWEETLFSKHLACADCGVNFEKLEPRLFSFNSPFGACQVCHGLGFVQKFDPELIIPNRDLTVWEGAIVPWKSQVYGFKGKLLEAVAEEIGLDLELPVKSWDNEHLNVVMQGFPDKKFKIENNGNVYSWGYEGIIPEMERLYKQTDSDARRREIEKYIFNLSCGACDGSRLREESRFVLINEKNIIDVTQMPIRECINFFEQVELTKSEAHIVAELKKEIITRLSFLLNVGLDYLTLSRSAGTLSGGEAQRIRLATQIGSELRGVMYILDEPSIGLHQRDNDRLIATLQHLRNLKNTVIVVEHDEDTIRQADYVIDIGPGAGVHGGEIVAAGTPEQVTKNKKSLTGHYLSGKKKIEVPKHRRRPQGFIKLFGAQENNLQNIDVEFPIGVLSCVTGVSGSGKSTLVLDTLQKVIRQKLNSQFKEKPGKYTSIENLGYIDKIISINQAPIGRTPRSNPATYTKVFTDIRELFAQTKEAKIRGYKPGRFSFNVAHGRCSQCEGDGMIKIEMNFLSDVYITCEQCDGKRYNNETLEVTYRDKTIADVLEMTVEQALDFFDKIPKIKKKLQTLVDVGLEYITLGQPATTLSGGEAQRIKLSTELAKRSTGRTYYILDEPTTGLHFADVQKLLIAINRLVEKGNSVLIIEHNLDVIKVADYIIDLGPEGGDGGGKIVAKGTPEEVAKNKISYTGKYLRPYLN